MDLTNAIKRLKKQLLSVLLCFLKWRRGWDSNPRYGVTVHLISNQARSTTPAPLHWSVILSSRRPAAASTPDLIRRYAPHPAGALRASKRLRRLSNQARSTTPAPLHWPVILYSGAEIVVSYPGNVKSPFTAFQCDNRAIRDMGSRVCDYCSSSRWQD